MLTHADLISSPVAALRLGLNPHFKSRPSDSYSSFYFSILLHLYNPPAALWQKRVVKMLQPASGATAVCFTEA